MAKRQTRRSVTNTTIKAAEQKIEEFTGDLGKLLGDARSKAEGWLGQRQAIADHLLNIRDTATGLLTQLGLVDAPQPSRSRGGQTASSRSRSTAAGRANGGGRKRRTMSEEARARISEAQRKRWARLRREKK